MKIRIYFEKLNSKTTAPILKNLTSFEREISNFKEKEGGGSLEPLEPPLDPPLAIGRIRCSYP